MNKKRCTTVFTKN